MFVSDDFIDSCVDTVCERCDRMRGGDRPAVVGAVQSVLVEVLEEVHHRLQDIEYDHSPIEVKDLIHDLEETIHGYQ